MRMQPDWLLCFVLPYLLPDIIITTTIIGVKYSLVCLFYTNVSVQQQVIDCRWKVVSNTKLDVYVCLVRLKISVWLDHSDLNWH